MWTIIVEAGGGFKKGEKAEVTLWESKYYKCLYQLKEIKCIYSKTKSPSNSENMRVSMRKILFF